MNLALRILGVAIFVSAFAGATYGAYQVFDTSPSFASVQVTGPSEAPSLLAGGSTPVRLGVENLGDATVNVTLRSGTDGFDVQTQPRVIAVEGNQTRPVRGLLSAKEDLLGNQTVRVEAVENGTDRTLGSTSFSVSVVEPVAPEISLDTVMPAVLSGQNASLDAQLTNTLSAQQRVNLTVSGADGTPNPRTVNLQPDGTGAATIEVRVPSDASGDLSVTVTAENQAGRSSSASTTLSVVPDGEVRVDALTDADAVRPGTSFTVPIVVVSNLAGPATVNVTAPSLQEAASTTVQARSDAGVFATLQVPEDASGTFDEQVTVTVDDRERTVDVSVSTSPSGETAEEGKQANVDYVGRLVDGSVFDSSVPGVVHGPFEKSTDFRARSQLSPLSLTLNPQRPGVISGFFDAVVGMQEGETKTVVLPPSEAYGPARQHENISATTEVPREQTVQRVLQDIPTRQLPPSFEIEDKEAGDTITYETDAGGTTIIFRFELTEKGENTVTLTRLAEEGERTTFYPPWPNATEVREVTENEIVYYTTPPEDAGAFAWNVNPNGHQAGWGNTTTVASMNETHITLQHSPEAGTTYQASPGPRQPPATYTVEGVNDENVHVSRENPNPLGGKTLVFDLHLRSVEDAPERQSPALPTPR